MENNRIKTLVIPAAGAGTRLLPLTSFIPKEMLRVVDKPAIYYAIQEAYLSGIHNVILIINPWKKSLREYLSGKAGESIAAEFPGMTFSFIETNDMLGDGQAICLAGEMVSESFFAISMPDLFSLPDQPFLKQLIGVHKRLKESIISVERIPRSEVNRYGVIDPGFRQGSLCKVKDIIEKPSMRLAPSNLAMTGKYIVSRKIFSYLDTLMQRRRPSQEIRLADALKEYAKVNALFALVCKGKYFDIGNKPDLLKTEFIFALRDKNLGKKFKEFVRRQVHGSYN